MRRTNITRQPPADRVTADLDDARPGRIRGATITSWNGPPEVDLAALFARPSGQASVTGSGQVTVTADPKPAEPGIVQLSDGTQITFATAGQFTVIETV